MKMVSRVFTHKLINNKWKRFRAQLTYAIGAAKNITEEHGLLYAPVFLSIGIAIYFSINFEPNSALVWQIWLASLALLLISHQIYVLRPEYIALRRMAFIICLIISGLFIAQYRTIQLHEPMLEKPLKFANVSGVIADVEVLAENGAQRMTLRDVHIDEIAPQKTPYSVRLKVRSTQIYEAGQRVEMLAALNPPSGPIVPRGFDFEQQSFFKRLGAVGFTYREPVIIAQNTEHSGSIFWENLRLFVSDQVKKSLPSHLQGVVITFMTGEKSSIAEPDLIAMRESGLAHLLAISGLHVGLVAGFVFFFVRLSLVLIPDMALKYPIKKWAAAIALIAAFCYMLLVGASIPTQRAMMMTGIALFAIIMDRSPFSLRMVALAAFIILIFYPHMLISASFQMSFAAVTALVGFYSCFRTQIQMLYRDAGWIKKAVLYIAGIALTTLIAGGATALYGLYHFQTWSVYSALANILAMPMVGIMVMPAAVLSYLLMPLGLSQYPLLLMGFGIDWVLYIAHSVADLEGAVVKIAAFSSYCLGAATFGGLLIICGPHFYRFIGAVIMGITIIVMVMTPSYSRLFIAEKFKLIGLYDVNLQTLYVDTPQREKYTRKNWSRLLGLEDNDVKPLEKHPSILCDHQACRLKINDINISLLKDKYVQSQECQWADIVIFEYYITPQLCRSALIIDKSTSDEGGALQITFKDLSFLILSTKDARGLRPWTQSTN